MCSTHDSNMFFRLLRKDNDAWDLFFNKAQPHSQTVNDQRRVISILKDKDDKLVKKTQKYMKKCATNDVNTTKSKEFTHVLTHLRNSKKVRKNIDQRIYWILNDILLCKKYFTLGVLNVDPGMAYTITTGKVNMDIYLTDIDLFENNYLPESSGLFTKDVLLAEESYILTKSFVLVASKHCLFKIQYGPLNGRKTSHPIDYPPSSLSHKVSSDSFKDAHLNMPIILL